MLSLFSKEPKEIHFFAAFRGLQLLIESGANLQQALIELAPMQSNAILSKALSNAAKSLSAGMSSGAAFRKEGIFSPMICSVIDVGDKTGQLSSVFQGLAKMMYLQHQLNSKIKSSLFIPKAAACIMVLLVIAYVKLAIPEYAKMYAENNIQMPWLLGVLSGIVDIIVDYCIIVIPLMMLLWKGFRNYCKKNRTVVDPIKLRMPIYAPLHFNILQYQFCSVMQLMLSSGLTIPAGLSEAAKSSENTVFASALTRCEKDVVTGHGLSESLRKNNGMKVIDPLLISAVKAGEKSNQLSKIFNENSDYYARSLNDLIEPTGTKITLVVMIPFGLLIIAMFLCTLIPMFDFISKTT